MNSPYKNNTVKEKPLLLFSALDWGLGHATRSIPLVKELLSLGYEIIIACNSTQKALLKPEFPELRYVELEGYDIRYGTTRMGTKLHLLFQLGKILTKIKNENHWLNTFLQENKVTGVISDNRYGLYSNKVPCVFITHQLQVRTGWGKIPDGLLRKFLYKYINRFSECWVPDYAHLQNTVYKEEGIAGALSHPVRLPAIPTRYLGCLSRFSDCKKSSPVEYLFDMLIVLSGPEPQRSVFEKIIIRQLETGNRKAVVIRGLPGYENLPAAAPGILMLNHAGAEQLNHLACHAAMVICRPGYTTIMDMLKLKKKMIVVPTPGQTEQEYLAHHLHTNRLALAAGQRRFSIHSAEKEAEAFDYRFIQESMELYKQVISSPLFG